MIVSLYSINDAIQGFGPIALQSNDAAAMRAFAEQFENVYSPADYSLFKLGTFDTETGEIITEIPSIICRATDFAKGDK